jgi:hypothetical protein
LQTDWEAVAAATAAATSSEIPVKKETNSYSSRKSTKS